MLKSTRICSSLAATLVLLLAGGCTSGPDSESASRPVAGASAPVETAAGARRVGGHPDAALHRVAVEVDPAAGAGVVLVNRIKLGPAPQVIDVPVTPQGFLAEPLHVAVRFPALAAGGEPLKVELVLAPTDRAPARLVFGLTGAQRIFGE